MLFTLEGERPETSPLPMPDSLEFGSLRFLTVVGVGLALGGVGAFVLVRLIRSLLYGIEPTDPAVMGSVALLLAATGVAACLLPARKATRIDPVVALTGE